MYICPICKKEAEKIIELFGYTIPSCCLQLRIRLIRSPDDTLSILFLKEVF